MGRIFLTSLDQLLKLRALGKTLLVLWLPTWKRRRLSPILFSIRNFCAEESEVCIVEVESCSSAEDYVVGELRATTLPLLCCFAGHALAFSLSEESLEQLPLRLTLSGLRLDSLAPFPRNVGPGQVVASLLGEGDANSAQPLRLFVAGDRSSVGKSSVCLGLLASLREGHGVAARRLGYIKPATQCEALQPIARYCARFQIEHVPIGPLVFYAGFTRAFLQGETEGREETLGRVRESVERLARGEGDGVETQKETNVMEKKALVLIDGVGYPAVGSIVGMSNATVAQTLRAPVLLVGKGGVGDAVDSFNLNGAFFEHHHVPVLGGVFNKLDREGFYSREVCEKSVTAYFKQNKPQQMPYGFLPIVPESLFEFDGITEKTLVEGENGNERSDFEGSWVDVFSRYVQLDRLLYDTFVQNIILRSEEGLKYRNIADKDVKQQQGVNGTASSSSNLSPPSYTANALSFQPLQQFVSNRKDWNVPPLLYTSTKDIITFPIPPASSSIDASGSKKRPREELEAEAKNKGAKGS